MEIIRLCDDSNINKYPEEVKQILELLKHPEALVTDMARVLDFSSPWSLDKYKEDKENLSTLLCREVEGNEFIRKLAEELNQKTKGKLE